MDNPQNYSVLFAVGCNSVAEFVTKHYIFIQNLMQFDPFILCRFQKTIYISKMFGNAFFCSCIAYIPHKLYVYEYSYLIIIPRLQS